MLFVTRWRILRASAAEVAEILEDAESYPHWWPEVYRDVKVLDHGGVGRVGCVVEACAQAFLPYELRYMLRVTESRSPFGFDMAVAGDLVGHGSWSISGSGDDVDVELRWEVEPRKAIIRALARPFPVVARMNHDWAMKRGKVALERELRRRRARRLVEAAHAPAPNEPIRVADEPVVTDVIIVGGGVAGLTSAVGLCGHGLDVTVLEAGPRLAGRAQSWTDETTGDPVHIGPHVFINAYSNVRRLLDELGTADRVLWQRDPFITIVDGERSFEIKVSRLPAPFHYAPSLIRAGVLGFADVLSNVRITQYLLGRREKDFAHLDQLNALGLLIQMGVSKPMIDWFWRFLSISLLNVPLEVCSALAIARIYRMMMGNSELQIGFATCGLGDLFADASRRLIEADGGHVHTNARVSTVLGDGESVHGVELADGRVILAPIVILALAPHELRAFVPARWRHHRAFRTLDAFQPVPYVATQLWFDRKLTSLRFWARRYRRDDMNCDFYDFSNIYPGWSRRASLIATNCIYSDRVAHLDDREHVGRTVAELAEFLPEAAGARLEHWTVHRIPMAIHAPFPGTESSRPQQKTEVRGLFLAGDWVSTGLPSSMESAACSGYRASELVLAARQVTKELVRPKWTIHPVARASGSLIPQAMLRPPPVPRGIG